MTKPPLKILVLDENTDGRTRLVRTLLRRFPTAVLLECRDPRSAAALAHDQDVDVALVHPTWEMNAENVLAGIRRHASDLPVLILTAAAHPPDARGSSIRYLDYDQWLLAGNVVEEMIQRGRKKSG